MHVAPKTPGQLPPKNNSPQNHDAIADCEQEGKQPHMLASRR